MALVLGAGGIKGWAHAGVLKVLHEARVPIDLIVGASAGALVGPLYAARRDAAEAERVALSFTSTDFLEWFLRDLRISPRGGRMGRRLWQTYGRLDFQELAVPLVAIALEVATGQRPAPTGRGEPPYDQSGLALREGNVGRAVEASIRPPLLARPIRKDGRILVDGGLHNALPVHVALEAGSRLVIAVNVGQFYTLPPRWRPWSARMAKACRRAKPASVASQVAFMAGLLSTGHAERPRADVEIRPDLRGISANWPWHSRQAVRRGELAARQALPEIRRRLGEAACR